jgi:Cyclic nucleotide-binding domain
MSGDNDPARDNEDEQETWKDLFGSVFDLADEVTSRISPDEIEKRLRRTLRKATGHPDPPPEEPEELAAASVAGLRAPSVAARGPATDGAVALAGAPELCSGTLHLSLGSRSLTVTLDQSVERSSAALHRSLKWWMASRAGSTGLRRNRWVPGNRPGSRKPRWGVNDPAALAYFSARARPGSFWAKLNPAEQELFWRLAREETYRAGETLMREGETPDDVVVIVNGRTMVSVRDGVAERVVAYRGPGDLIGERAVLQVTVRSATVVAVETVQALVLRTQDFAAFISAHPGVLSFIEKMINDRLNEDPPGPEYDPGLTGGPGGDRSAGRPGPEPGSAADGQSTVVAASVLGFDRMLCGTGDRRIMHTAMVEMTRSALAGMSEDCWFEDRGDGVLVIVPPAVPTPAIMERLTGTLPAAVRWHNRIYNVFAQVQMRIAVDTGPVNSQDQVMADEVLGQAGQLLKTPALTRAISRSRANLGMIVSSSVYDTAIRPYGGPVGYEPVRIERRGSSQQAWMHVIDPAPDRLTRIA